MLSNRGSFVQSFQSVTEEKVEGQDMPSDVMFDVQCEDYSDEEDV